MRAGTFNAFFAQKRNSESQGGLPGVDSELRLWEGGLSLETQGGPEWQSVPLPGEAGRSSWLYWEVLICGAVACPSPRGRPGTALTTSTRTPRPLPSRGPCWLPANPTWF